MAVIDINWNPSRRELRQFAALWLVFFAIAGAVLWYKMGMIQVAIGLWAMALVTSSIGFIFPRFMRVIFVGWMVAAFPIGWTISHVILTIIFFLVITPIGLLVRLFSGDPLQRRFDRSAKSYWAPHEPNQSSSRYFKQF